ncbi:MULTISPECIES: hypothetical protein [unclassified Marinobacterium]|uniref:hypothetical protein n=1 Tax=unclassified Marinobacterium TaxID=2644139 RepID=UPI00156845ED|nr:MULTISPECIES: hypothetical protein [unclassified Marinobacterium]NRP10150.1 hypothetical protein [Marinobacterium sp. xm-g-48]NRP15521.1 hypothetical protein [Marinobacterium sp. xm-a-152]NRP27785.1 hypothetical protein [Marinobacterium sp. xm-d-420]NRP38364.1 hypothetical protein [Marinobacterium sp. xm-a-121]NRP47148.1 hypothetical protein [Marinobacterium sp. xm-d-543]
MIRDDDLAFFKPKARRYGTVIFTGLWAAAEWFFWGAAPFWSILATGLFGYTYWRLIHTYPKEL